ncbi:MAG: class D sortase [Pseudobutyrivibrio sp.]|nr:class D sortase [Pseudobutyrivibrio sp.]
MIKKQLIKQVIGIVLIGVGLGIILTSILLNIKQYSSKKELIQEFRNNIQVVQQDEPDSGNPAVEGDVLYIVRIPKIDSENPVREGVSKGVLADSLGHEPSTSYIGQGGNCVIAGHRNYTFGKFFNRLDEVEIGDEILVDTKTETLTYEVKEIKVVEPTELSILDNTDKEQLTLYTCTPIYVATHRLVIIAEPK